MQTDILESRPTSPLVVSVVWFSVLGGDQRSAVDTSLLTDERAVHYWDDDAELSHFLSVHSSELGFEVDGTLWDAYLLFAPGARWNDIPEPLVGFGAPVIAAADRLALELDQVLDQEPEQ